MATTLGFLTAVTTVLLLNVASPADAGDDAAAVERLRTTLLQEYLIKRLGDQYKSTFSVEFPECPQVLNGILSGSVVVRTVWIDKQLHWEPRDYNDITAIDMNLDSVQHPTVKLVEVKEKWMKRNADEFETVRVTYEGIVSWDHSIDVNRECKPFSNKYWECELLFQMYNDGYNWSPQNDRLKSMHKDSAVDAEKCPGIDAASSESVSLHSHITAYKVVVRVPAS